MQNAAEFVQGFLDEELGLDVPQVDPAAGSGRTRIAVLCSPLYSKNAQIDECVHWMPGWLGTDLEDVQDKGGLVNTIVANAQSNIDQTLAELQARSAIEEDPALKWSLSNEIENQTVVRSNLTELLLGLWREHGIIATPALSDGNCGVHTAMAFGNHISASIINGKDASDEDITQIVALVRKEISQMWKDASDDLLWQQIFQRFIEGRIDLRNWKVLTEPQVHTPSPRKGGRRRQKSMSFTPTPNKRAAGRRRAADGHARSGIPGEGGAGKQGAADGQETPGTLGEGVDAEPQGKLISGKGIEQCPDSIIVELPPSQPSKKKRVNSKEEGEEQEEDGQEAPPKKKRTGKKLPLEQTHTFNNLFSRFLADRGITYRTFLGIHRKNQVLLVFLVGIPLCWWVLSARLC